MGGCFGYEIHHDRRRSAIDGREGSRDQAAGGKAAGPVVRYPRAVTRGAGRGGR
ncbi:hypothetical protein GCM10027176_33300 [Actinoallomurus bryophytorum]